jgi:hypothetical protein
VGDDWQDYQPAKQDDQQWRDYSEDKKPQPTALDTAKRLGSRFVEHMGTAAKTFYPVRLATGIYEKAIGAPEANEHLRSIIPDAIRDFALAGGAEGGEAPITSKPAIPVERGARTMWGKAIPSAEPAPFPEKPPTSILRAAPLGVGGQPSPESPAINLGRIPAKPVYPGAHLPEHPGTFTGAHLPENPGVFPGAPLPETPAINLRQANALTRLPATKAIPAAQSGEALGSIPAGKPISTGTPTPRAISSTLDTTLRAAVGNKPIQAGVPIKNQYKPAIPTEVAEGHTGVSSTALKSFKYDAATKELHVTPSSGNTVVYGDVTPEQAEAFKSASSKGQAWKAIRDNNPLVAKVADGKRIPVKPAVRLRSAAPEAAPKAVNVPAPTEDLTPILQKSLQTIKPASTSTSIPGGQPSGVPSILEAAKRRLSVMSKKEVSEIGKERGIDLTDGNDPDGTGAISTKGAAVRAIIGDLSPEELAGR